MRGEAQYLSTDPPDFWGEAGQVISYTLNDVIALRKDVTLQTTALGNVVARCTSLDSATQDQWHTMRERAIAWLSDQPSWFRSDSQYRAGDAIRKDLQPWYARLDAAGCNAGAAPNEPSKPLAGAGDTLTRALGWGVAIVGGILLISVIDKTGLPRLFPKGGKR